MMLGGWLSPTSTEGRGPAGPVDSREETGNILIYKLSTVVHVCIYIYKYIYTYIYMYIYTINMTVI